MKFNIGMLLLAFVFNIGTAQKIIEKNLEYDNQFIELDVKFARDIEVKTWDQPKVYFKATIVAKEEMFIDKYEVDFKTSNSYITIEERAEPVFKAMKEYADKNDWNNKRYWYNSGDLYKFFYVLYVPKNAKFKVSSINGDLESDRIYGDFEADLINGDIEINEYQGTLNLSTINGEIDLNVGTSSFVAETIHGDIYADEKLKVKSHGRHVGQKVESVAANGTSRIKLNTINGNMYLRL